MPDWNAVFSPTVPILEIVLRGTLMFLGVTTLLRFAGQREAGGLSLTDLVVVLVATAAGQGMAGGYESVPEGLVLAATILGWSVLLDAMAYKVPSLGRLLKARPQPLIEDGRVNRHVLRREFLSVEELEAQLRLQGVTAIDDVAAAYLEPNGMISVFPRRDPSAKHRQEPPTLH